MTSVLKFLLFLCLLGVPIALHAQVPAQPVALYGGTPPIGGPCIVNATTPVGWVTPAGAIVTCQGGVWANVGGSTFTFPTSAHLIGTNGSALPITATATDLAAPEYIVGGGSANAQTATLTPAITAYTAGLQVCWLPPAANTTTTPTLAVNGLAATTITKLGTAALVASDLTTTAVACARYISPNFQLQNPQTSASGSGTVNNCATNNGVAIYSTSGTAVSCIPGAANGILSYNGSGVPSISNTLPAGVYGSMTSADVNAALTPCTFTAGAITGCVSAAFSGSNAFINLPSNTSHSFSSGDLVNNAGVLQFNNGSVTYPVLLRAANTCAAFGTTACQGSYQLLLQGANNTAFAIFNQTDSNFSGFRFQNSGVDRFTTVMQGSGTNAFYEISRFDGTGVFQDNPLSIAVNTGIVTFADTPRLNGGNTTGVGSALLGTNSPASTLTAPYTWITLISSDGSTVYMPVWK